MVQTIYICFKTLEVGLKFLKPDTPDAYESADSAQTEYAQYIFHHIAAVASPRGNRGNVFPSKPEKVAKDGEQPRRQPTIRNDSSRKLYFR